MTGLSQFDGISKFGGLSQFDGLNQFGGLSQFDGLSKFGGLSEFNGLSQFDRPILMKWCDHAKTRYNIKCNPSNQYKVYLPVYCYGC